MIDSRDIWTNGHASISAAVRAFDRRNPGWKPSEVAQAIGCAGLQVLKVRERDRRRPLQGPRPKMPGTAQGRRRARLLDRGLCQYCGKRPHEPERKGCALCLGVTAQRVSATHAERIRAGVCVDCEGVPVPGKRQCSTCQRDHRERVAAARAERGPS